MSRNNTGNPIGSKAFPDFEDNVKNLDQAVNAEQDTFQDRLGKSRLTWAGVIRSGTGDPSIAVDAAARAEAAASQVQQDAEQIAQDAAQQAASAVMAGVDGSVAVAQSAADRAEAASDAAFVNADVYPDVATGRAAVADGDQFQVVEGDEIVRYRRDSASTETEVARYPAAGKVDKVAAKVPRALQYSASIGSGLATASVDERFLVPDEDGATIYQSDGNLFDPSAVVDGRYIDGSTGDSVAAVDWAHSGFINVTPGEAITIASNTAKRAGAAFYDANRNTILPVINSSDNPLTLIPPAGAAFLRFNVKSDVIPQPTEIMVNTGGPKPYRPFGSNEAVEVAALLGKSEFSKVTTAITSDNLFVIDNVIEGVYQRATAPLTLEAAPGWACVAIAASEGDVFTIYSANSQPRRSGVAFYDKANPGLGDLALEGSYTGGGGVKTVTAPAGAQSMVVNVQSSTIPMPTDLMIVRGTTIIPYVPGGTRLVVPRDVIWPPVSEGDGDGSLTATLSGTPGGLSSVKSDMTGIERAFVAAPTESVLDYPVRFNLRADSIGGVTIRDSVDDIAPDHIDGWTVGANHGYLLGLVTASAHGKTVEDCGSVWTSGGAEYVLADIVDANTILLAHTEQNEVPPAGTYSHVSGATNTANIIATSVASRQWYPPHKDWALNVLADGRPVSLDSGTVKASVLQFVERADIVSRQDIIAAWVADGGIPAGYEPDAPTSIAESITYTYDHQAQLTITKTWFVAKAIQLQDLMGLQFARMGGEQTYIIPGSIPFEYQGETLDYSMGVAADYTLASGVSVRMGSTNLQAEGEYAHRVLVLYPDAVFAIGLLPVGDAAYEVRRERVSNRALEIRGNTGKLYFRVLDKGAHAASPGDQYSVVGYRYILPKSTDRTAFYAVEGGGATWVYADWHNKDGLDRLPIDEQYPELIGRSFEIVEARNVSVSTGVIAGSLPVIVSAGDSSATLILKVG